MTSTPPAPRRHGALLLALLCGAACSGESPTDAPRPAVGGSAPAAKAPAESRVDSDAPPQSATARPEFGARFLARLELPLAGKPTGVVAHDLDGDGHRELIAAAREPGGLHVFLGGPDGPHVPAVRIPLDDWPLGPVLLARDEQEPSLVATVSQVSRELVVFDLTDPHRPRRVAAVTLDEAPRALCAGDVGADGTLDVVVATETQLLSFPVAHDEPALGGGRALGRPEARALAGERATCVGVLTDGRIAVGHQVPRAVFVHAGHAAPAGIETPTRLDLSEIPRALLDLDLDGPAAGLGADGAGDAELVVTGGEHAVWVFGLEGERDGTSEPRQFATPGLVPLRMLAADLDGDGARELILLHNHSLDFAVLGRFGPRGPALVLSPDTNVGQTPVALALADLDSDGRTDLAVANRDARRISLLRGTGFAEAGRLVFYAALQTAAGSDPVDVCALELDGDNQLDVVSLDVVDETLSLLPNRFGLLQPVSPGVGARVAVGPGARRIERGDFDGDGQDDVAVLIERAGSTFVRVLPGDGAGGLDVARAREVPAGVSGADLLVADLQGDGCDDLLVADVADQALTWVECAPASPSSGAGEFDLRPARRIELGVAPFAVVALPGSDAPTLAVAFADPRTGAGIALVRAGPTPRVEFLPARTAGHTPVDLCAADFDGDGRADLALLLRVPLDSAAGRLSVWLATETGFVESAVVATGTLPRCLAAGDLDGDGRADLVVSAQNSHHVNVWLARGDEFRLDRQVDLGAHLGPTRLTLADLGDDGRLEILVANTFSDDVSAIYNAALR